MKLFFSPERALKAVGCTAFAALLMGFVSPANAQTSYSTSFDNLVPNSTLDGQDGWTDSDTNSPDSVAVFGGYSATTGDYLASLGGAYIGGGGGPTTPTAYLSHAFLPGPATTYYFNTDFAVLKSSSPYVNENTFNFTFRGTAGNLFSVDLVPNGGTSATATNDAVRYTTYSNPVTGANTQTSTGLGVPLGARYHLAMTVNTVANTFTFQLISETATGVLSANPAYTSPTIALGLAGAAALVTNFAVTYNVGPSADGAVPGSGAGSNSILFDNISAIPEPSTWAMVGLGTLGLGVSLRRKSKV